MRGLEKKNRTRQQTRGSWRESKREGEGGGRTVVTGPHGEQDLADIHTGDGSVGLAPRTAHSGLQPVGTGTGQHLVDADDVVRVGADTEVEPFLAGDFDEISVGRTSSESAGADGIEMDTE